MSILIKGMDKETAVRICAYAGLRMDDSDFVPVPPHGDLIDKDELKMAWDGVEENMHTPVAVIRALIDDAPTIIDAEENE